MLVALLTIAFYSHSVPNNYVCSTMGGLPGKNYALHFLYQALIYGKIYTLLSVYPQEVLYK